VKINDKEVDLSKAIPLTLKDWREVRKRFNYDVMVERAPTLDHMIGLATYCIQKANPKVTEEEVLELSIPDLNEISQKASQSGEESVDRPT
jgi:hypothetical protein